MTNDWKAFEAEARSGLDHIMNTQFSGEPGIPPEMGIVAADPIQELPAEVSYPAALPSHETRSFADHGLPADKNAVLLVIEEVDGIFAQYQFKNGALHFASDLGWVREGGPYTNNELEVRKALFDNDWIVTLLTKNPGMTVRGTVYLDNNQEQCVAVVDVLDNTGRRLPPVSWPPAAIDHTPTVALGGPFTEKDIEILARDGSKVKPGTHRKGLTVRHYFILGEILYHENPSA